MVQAHDAERKYNEKRREKRRIAKNRLVGKSSVSAPSNTKFLHADKDKSTRDCTSSEARKRAKLQGAALSSFLGARALSTPSPHAKERAPRQLTPPEERKLAKLKGAAKATFLKSLGSFVLSEPVHECSPQPTKMQTRFLLPSGAVTRSQEKAPPLHCTCRRSDDGVSAMVAM